MDKFKQILLRTRGGKSTNNNASTTNMNGASEDPNDEEKQQFLTHKQLQAPKLNHNHQRIRIPKVETIQQQQQQQQDETEENNDDHDEKKNRTNKLYTIVRTLRSHYWNPSAKTTNKNSTSTNAHPWKLTFIILLVLQTSFHTLVGRYTRSVLPKAELYEVTHLIIMVEIIKLFISCVLESYTTNGQLLQSLKTYVLYNPLDAIKTCIPALMFVVQNSLIFIGLTNLSAPFFISINQSKVVITALVSIIMLHRSYTIQQWVCLVTMTLGVILLILEEQNNQNQAQQQQQQPQLDTIEQQASHKENEKNFIIGLLSVLGASFSSAFAGVYFELVLSPERQKIKIKKNNKNTPTKSSSRIDEETAEKTTDTSRPPLAPINTTNSHILTRQESSFYYEYDSSKLPPASMWMRNIQLAFFSLLSCMVGNYMNHPSNKNTTYDDERKPFFYGFNKWVWILILLQAIGGLLVAAVMKTSDSVIKSLTTGVSVFLTATISAILFKDKHVLSIRYLVGATIIFVSLYYFSNPTKAKGTNTFHSNTTTTATTPTKITATTRTNTNLNGSHHNTNNNHTQTKNITNNYMDTGMDANKSGSGTEATS